MADKPAQVLLPQRPWQGAYFYQKTEVLYLLTYHFCQRFLPAHGDRTVDQMIQAARSGKQNIIEGVEAGQSSTETHIRLLNVARASLQELREDYRDYLATRQLPLWDDRHRRYKAMRTFCSTHNLKSDYEPYFQEWNAEEMSNIAYTLCRIVDTMLQSHLDTLQKEFIQHGGIKERMHALRTGYRQAEMEELQHLRDENQRLRQILANLGHNPDTLLKNH